MTITDDDRNKAIGAALRAERARLGWSRDQTHEATGIPPSTLRRYESGERAITAPTLWKLLEAFGIGFGDFMHQVERSM